MDFSKVFKNQRSAVLARGIEFLVKNGFTMLVWEDSKQDVGREAIRFVETVEIKKVKFCVLVEYEGQYDRWKMTVRTAPSQKEFFVSHNKSVSSMVEQFVSYARELLK